MTHYLSLRVQNPDLTIEKNSGQVTLIGTLHMAPFVAQTTDNMGSTCGGSYPDWTHGWRTLRLGGVGRRRSFLIFELKRKFFQRIFLLHDCDRLAATPLKHGIHPLRVHGLAALDLDRRIMSSFPT